ncbi:MAG TPA: hypothetical protein VFZ99_07570 [Terriglobales bacterium]
MKSLSLILASCLALLTACGRSNPKNAATPAPSESAAAKPAAPMPKLGPGECGDPDGSHGYVRIKSSDASGPLQNCSFQTSSNGLIALKATNTAGKQNAIILLAILKSGTQQCHDKVPTAVNYRASNPPRVLYVAGAKLGECEIKSTAVDAKQWKGTATAKMVPGGKDQHNTAAKPLSVQVEWALNK